ncbi:hypothetical protein ARMA_0492 [Ardenticatena maritima]|uniref:DUF2085 domain-containing protein n=1 Tax=Ardenticatena maritima TaxID=872965 RepID=A0A0M8K7I4_9CHLR|nr:DUF2085 domain-containing protein [Ardenticatena maritima]KPL87847.1 hypothetical protein SE16_09885 [Ardenticatena maritima]GAP62069.1 hypothetical protein ARMA_0492 [Ardenticatena maritima]
MQQKPVDTPSSRRFAHLVLMLQTGVYWIARHWLLLFNGFWALFLGGIFLTPLLMVAGFERTANVLYTLYGSTCHQLPDRSYFFGGEMRAFFSTYDLATLIAHGANATNELTLRAFRGDAVLGYKTAVGFRCIAEYSGVLGMGLLYALVRHWKRLPRLPWWGLVLMSLPMAIDGTSHLINDITGWGFRDTNTWAMALTGNMFPPEFYTGTQLWSLNWWLRTLTGLLFGAGVVWFAYPLLNEGMCEIADEAKTALAQTRQRLQANV